MLSLCPLPCKICFPHSHFFPPPSYFLYFPADTFETLRHLKNTYTKTQAAHYVQTSWTPADYILKNANTFRPTLSEIMWFKQCHYLCSFRGRVVSDLRLPWRHYVQHFTLILLLCENDLWLTEGSANFLRFHAWRNNKPCFCPADGFLFLLSPLVLCVDIKSSSFILPKTWICLLNKASLFVCDFQFI